MSTITICTPPVRRTARRRSPRVAPRRLTGTVRLTPRGRLVVVVLLLALVVAAVALVRAPATGSSPVAASAAQPVAHRVTVRPGQTLWQIARDAVPGADPRVTIARIKEMNGLSSSGIESGRVLLVPPR